MSTESGAFLVLCLSMIAERAHSAPWEEASGFLLKSLVDSRIGSMDVCRAVNTDVFELVGAADIRRVSNSSQFGTMVKLYVLTDCMDPLQ